MYHHANIAFPHNPMQMYMPAPPPNFQYPPQAHPSGPQPAPPFQPVGNVCCFSLLTLGGKICIIFIYLLLSNFQVGAYPPMPHPQMPSNQPFSPLIYPHDMNQRQAVPDGGDRSGAMHTAFTRSPSHNMPMPPNMQFFAPPPPPPPPNRSAMPPQPPMPNLRNQGQPGGQPPVPPPQSGLHQMQPNQHGVHHGPMMYPPFVQTGPLAAPMPGRQRHPMHFNPTQLRYLMAAYNVGMLAMDTLARRVHDDRPQAKYARNPP